jgi:quinol monooxygenase YgiN
MEAEVAILKHLSAAIAIAFVSAIALAGSYSVGAAIPPEQSTPGPVLAVISQPVADYAAWRVIYDAGQPARDTMGVTGAEVFVDPANPSMVVVIHRFPSVEAANEFLQHPAFKDAMTRAGVTAPPMIILASTT